MRASVDGMTARDLLRALLGAAVASILVGCPGSGDHRSASPPIVLISVDTLRSDRLPAYGYDRIETPAIDRLRADSILYERAYSHVPLTLPAHASLLTGLLPPEHGVRTNVGYRLEADALPYLPSLLRAAGYATGAAISSYVLRGPTGLSTDFDWYDDRLELTSRASLGRQQRPGQATLEAALEWLRRHSADEATSGRPLFLFFHIYEPHSPYDAPEPFRSRYADPYDAEIAEADRVVGLLLEELARLGLYEDSLIVFLSDHGEGLGEHGQPHHEVFVYRESLQVPLLLKLPGGRRAGESVARPVQLIDVLPTLYEVIGQPPPPELRGASLLDDSAPAGRPVYAESLYPRIHFGWSELTSLIEDDLHYIEAPSPELYDLAKDPGELQNIRRANRRLAGRMAETLAAYSKPFEGPASIDPETRERLAALGYVGTTVDPAEDEDRPDPKERLAVLEPLGRAFRLFFDGDFETAAGAFEQIVELEPQLVDAWDHLGKSLYFLGHHEEALAAYRRALEVSGGAPTVALSAAEVFLAVGDLEAAGEHARLATATHESAWDVLVQVAMRKGDLATAEGHLQTALSLRGTRIRPLILESELRLRQGRFEEALELSRKIETEAGDRSAAGWPTGLYLVRGQALGHLGRVDEAKRAFGREIESSPHLVEAYAHLAFLHAMEGNAQEAGSVLRRALAANPNPAAYETTIRTLIAMGDPDSAAALRSRALELWPANERLLALEHR